jgi:hypothetical protein
MDSIAHRVPPRARGGCDIAPAGVPLGVRHTVVVGDTELLNTRAPLGLLPVRLLAMEVEVPELKLRLGRRADSRKYDVSPLWRPAHGVARPPRERLYIGRVSHFDAQERNSVKLTELLEVALLPVELVEADVRLDRDAGAGVAHIRVAARDDGEALAPRLPRKVKHSILELNDLYRVVLLAQAEDLEVAEDGLLRLRVPVDLDTEEVALVLPVEFALGEQG